jgi:hypothetical protein
LGKRSRKRRDAPAAPARRAAPAARRPAPTAERPQSRSEQRNAEARANLEPLEPGERPRAVIVGAIVALGLVVANIAVYAAGVKVRGDRPAFVGFLAFSVLMLAMAWGLWRARYWAVLGLEALLGILMVIFSLFLLRFQTVTDVVICVAVLIPSGTLFWFLIKAMARIQMPQRPR